MTESQQRARARTYVTSFVVEGEAASKANSRSLVLMRSKASGGKVYIRSKAGGFMTGRVGFIKSAKARTFSENVMLQVAALQPTPTMLLSDVCLNIHMYYATRRPDMDESALLDSLQGVIYKNDRQVKERHVYWHLDPDRPRCEIDVYALEDLPKRR